MAKKIIIDEESPLEDYTIEELSDSLKLYINDSSAGALDIDVGDFNDSVIINSNLLGNSGKNDFQLGNGKNKFTINADIIADTTINAGLGNDSVKSTVSDEVSATINLGAGINKISSKAYNSQNLSITTGLDKDSLSISGGDITLSANLGDGNNILKAGGMSNALIGGYLSLTDYSGGTGKDKITLLSKTGSVNILSASLGEGDNSLISKSGYFTGIYDLSSGSGKDKIALQSFNHETIYVGDLDLGDGSNSFSVKSGGFFNANSLNFGNVVDKISIFANDEIKINNQIDLGAGKNSFKVGSLTDIRINRIEAEDGFDKIFLKAGGDLSILDEINLGAGKNNLKIQSDGKVYIKDYYGGGNKDKISIKGTEVEANINTESGSSKIDINTYIGALHVDLKGSDDLKIKANPKGYIAQEQDPELETEFTLDIDIIPGSEGATSDVDVVVNGDISDLNIYSAGSGHKIDVKANNIGGNEDLNEEPMAQIYITGSTELNIETYDSSFFGMLGNVNNEHLQEGRASIEIEADKSLDLLIDSSSDGAYLNSYIDLVGNDISVAYDSDNDLDSIHIQFDAKNEAELELTGGIIDGNQLTVAGINFLDLENSSTLDISVFADGFSGTIDVETDGLVGNAISGLNETWTYNQGEFTETLSNSSITLNVGNGIYNEDAGTYTFDGLLF